MAARIPAPENRRSPSTLWRLAVTLGLALVAQTSGALEPPYLDEWPDPERVVQDFRGDDELDTLARQIGALRRLNTMLRDLAGDRESTDAFTPDEMRIMQAIGTVASRLEQQGMAMIPENQRVGSDSLRAKWMASITRYSLMDDDFYDEVTERYFSPELRAAHRAVVEGERDFLAAYRKRERRDMRAAAGVEEKRTAFTRLPEREQRNILLLGAAMIVLIAFSVLRLLTTRSEFDPSNPRVLRGGWRSRAHVDWATGVMGDYSARKDIEVVVKLQPTSARGDPNNPTQEQLRGVYWYIRHYFEDFALVTPAGKHEVYLYHRTRTRQPPQPGEPEDTWDGTVRGLVGQRLSAVWAGTSKKRPGHYLLFLAWDKGQAFEIEGPSVTLLAPAAATWMVVPMVVLGYLIGAWTGILGTLGPRLLRGLAMAAVGLVLWLVVTWLLHALRSSRFHKTQVDVFAELIDPRDALPADPAMIPARPQPQQKR